MPMGADRTSQRAGRLEDQHILSLIVTIVKRRARLITSNALE